MVSARVQGVGSARIRSNTQLDPDSFLDMFNSSSKLV